MTSKVRPERVFKIQFIWKDFEIQPGKSYVFPERPSPYMREYIRPGVYRWIVFRPDGVADAIYVGEAEDFKRRLGDYLRPGNRKTASRIHNWLQCSKKAGMDIKFQFLQFENFTINSRAYGCDGLNDPFARKAVENLAILDAFQEIGCLILNKGSNLIQKKVVKANRQFGRLTADQKRKIIERPFAEVIDELSLRRSVKRKPQATSSTTEDCADPLLEHMDKGSHQDDATEGALIRRTL